MPIELRNKEYSIHGDYTHERSKNENKRVLDIRIPDAASTEFRCGFYAKFERTQHYDPDPDLDTSPFHSGSVKDGKDYYHNKKLVKIFTEEIQPLLEEKLPKYMTELIKFN